MQHLVDKSLGMSANVSERIPEEILKEYMNEICMSLCSYSQRNSLQTFLLSKSGTNYSQTYFSLRNYCSTSYVTWVSERIPTEFSKAP